MSTSVLGARPPGHRVQQSDWDHKQATHRHRRERRDLALQAELLDALLEPRLQAVGAPAGFVGVQPGIGLAGLLLELELLGAVVPVADLLGQAILDGRLGLVDQVRRCGREPRPRCSGTTVRSHGQLRLLLEFPRDPGALWAGKDRLSVRLAVARGR